MGLHPALSGAVVRVRGDSCPCLPPTSKQDPALLNDSCPISSEMSLARWGQSRLFLRGCRNSSEKSQAHTSVGSAACCAPTALPSYPVTQALRPAGICLSPLSLSIFFSLPPSFSLPHPCLSPLKWPRPPPDSLLYCWPPSRHLFPFPLGGDQEGPSGGCGERER